MGMEEFIHRYAPAEPFPRLVVALLAGIVAAPSLVYGLVALVVPLQRSIYIYLGPRPTTAVLLLLTGWLFGSVAYHLARGVADQAEAAPREANPARTNRNRDREDDPVRTLQERYAAGELDEAEFDRRVERLLESDDRRDRVTEGELVE